VTTAVTELYDALKQAGVPDDVALKAAQSVSGSDLSHLASKSDLHQMETRIIKWNAGTMIAMTAIFGAIVKLL